MADDPRTERPAKPPSKRRGKIARAKQGLPRTIAKTSSSSRSSHLSAEDLLSAANSASATARNAWLAFVLLLAYLLVTLAGVTHQNLLLNSPVTLPIVGVQIPLFTFFLAAPVLLILVHLGLLVQHALLSHKLYHFSRAISVDEAPGERDHPLRIRLHNYTYSQLLAGPKPPKRLEWLLRRMVFFTLAALPVLTLLYLQIKFLPYHEVAVTYWHRSMIILDIVLLFTMRRIIGMHLFRKGSAMIEPDEADWHWRLTRTGYWAGIAISAVILLFSFLVATVPDAGLDRLTRSINWLASDVQSAGLKRKVFGPTAWLFEGEADLVRGQADTPFGWSRNLIVTDKDLVPDREDQHGEVSQSLRGRDLRYAVLDRTDLHRADLTGADLRWSSLRATRLEHVTAGCVDEFGDGSHEYREEDCLQLQGANMIWAQLQNAYLVGVKMENANVVSAKLHKADLRWGRMRQARFVKSELKKAKLSASELQNTSFHEANLAGADLSDASLEEATLTKANLERAQLALATMQGANLSDSQLQGTLLFGAELQGADLVFTGLQGAKMSEAQLQGADLSDASLLGADLYGAELQGAKLQDAKLQGADLSDARMQGADLDGAEFQGADLRQAAVWQTQPPDQSSIAHADFEGLILAAPSANEIAGLETLLGGIANKDVQERVARRLAPLRDADARAAWAQSPQHQEWFKIKERQRPDRAELTTFLSELACDVDPDGYIAEEFVTRSLRALRALRDSKEDDSRFDAQRLAKALLAKSCEGAESLREELKTELQKLLDKLSRARREPQAAAPAR